MKCEECKNFEAKEKPQRVTVLTFDRDGKQGSYSFAGKPDWARIERETIGAGMMAVIVKLPKDAVRIAQKCLGMDGWDRDYTGAIPYDHEFTGIALFCRYSISLEIDRIQSAIAAWRERQPKPWVPQVGEKVWWDGVQVLDGGSSRQAESPGVYTLHKTPQTCNIAWRVGYRLAESYHWTTLDHLRPASAAPEHYDGEPCELPVCYADKAEAEGLSFVYADKRMRPVKLGDWCVSCANKEIILANYKGIVGGMRWILRAVPVEPPKPEWKVGDWAYHSFDGIVEITEVQPNGACAYTVFSDGRKALHCIQHLRPLCPADWTREIGGIKVRAYEKECGDICIKAGDKSICVGTNEFKSVLREFCAAKGLPVMPFALHQGKMDPPE